MPDSGLGSNQHARSIPPMNKPVLPIELQYEDDAPLYVAQKKVYPQSVSGTFRRIKWGLMAFCLGGLLPAAVRALEPRPGLRRTRRC